MISALCIFCKATATTQAVEAERAQDCLILCARTVAFSQAPKCVRCWNHDEGVGADHDHPELCPRCAAVVRSL